MTFQPSSKILRTIEVFKEISPSHVSELTQLSHECAQKHSCFRCPKSMISAQIRTIYKNPARPDLGVDEYPVLELLGCQAWISHPSSSAGEEVGIKPSSALIFVCSEEVSENAGLGSELLDQMSLFNRVHDSQNQQPQAQNLHQRQP